jgi:ferredoxin
VPQLLLTPLRGHPARDDQLNDDDATLAIDVPRGTTVLDAAISHQVPIATLCGGAMHCRMCIVRVDGAAAGSPCGVREQDVLSREGAHEGERLACQVRVLDDGLRVFIPHPLERLR